MSDDKTERDQPDRGRISTKQRHEMAYATKALSKTAEQMKEAVKQCAAHQGQVELSLSQGIGMRYVISSMVGLLVACSSLPPSPTTTASSSAYQRDVQGYMNAGG